MIQLPILGSLDICAFKNWPMDTKIQQNILPFPRIRELIQFYDHLYSNLIKNKFVDTDKKF